MMNKHRTYSLRRRRHGRGRDSRLEALEEIVAPPETDPVREQIDLQNSVQHWAATQPQDSYPSALYQRLTHLCAGDYVAFLTRDDVSERYVQDSVHRFGEMRFDFTREQQTEYDELNARIDATWRELVGLWEAAGAPRDRRFG